MLGWLLPLLFLLLVAVGLSLWTFVSAGGLSGLPLALGQRRLRGARPRPRIFEEVPLQVDGGLCTLCRLCADCCPTGAFEVGRNGGPVLTFRPSDCIGCGICVRFCPTGAITLRHPAPVVNSSPAPPRHTPVTWEAPECGHELPPPGVCLARILADAQPSCPYCAGRIEASIQEVRQGTKVS